MVAKFSYANTNTQPQQHNHNTKGGLMPKAKDTNTNEWFTFESYSADDLCNTLAQSLDKLEMLGCNDTQVKSDIESAIATISTNDCELIVRKKHND
jgi:hypothetical protein|tara:strand:- start:6939 stop:7226 length:288 start_codon:yes stop_codon:yes gene_type:complete